MTAQLLQNVWWVAAMGITLLLPGAAWLAWFPVRERDFAQCLAAALGISISLTALGALATFITGVHLNGPALILIYLLLAAAALAGWLRRRPALRLSGGFVLTVVLGVGIVAWRLYQASSLVLPPWVDSLHHVLIVRILLEHGGLPGDLSPYLPVLFYYHFGFHSLAAVYAFVAGLAPDRAAMITGQVLNAGVCLAVYRLGWAIWRDARRGLAAVLLVAFVSTMPAYYLTWGRYTLLVGLILMALVMAEVLDFIRYRNKVVIGAEIPETHNCQEWPFSRPTTNLLPDDVSLVEPAWRFAVRLALFTAGVLLSHYLMGLLLALFLVVCGVYLAWRDLRSFPSRFVLWSGWLPLLAAVFAGTLLALPWILRAIRYSTGSISLEVTLPVELGGQGVAASYASYLWNLLGPVRNHWLLLLGGLGLLLVGIRSTCLDSRGERLLSVWSAMLVLGCLPFGLNLAPFQPHHLVMVVFLPVVLLAGNLLVSAGEAVGSVTRRAWLGWVAAGLALALVCGWGFKETGNIINRVTILATPADRLALDWIQANTPEDARFLINTALWQGTIYRGVDGGWWILPYTGRQTLLPPVVYSWGKPDYVNQINAWAQKASALKTCSVEFWKLVVDARLTYVYLRQGAGSLQPDGLKDCPRLNVVYQNQDVVIYQVTP
jgi:hypothetical protein